MNKQINRTVRIALACCFGMALSLGGAGGASAADLDKPVFDYQAKMAKMGNAQAQYYLAQMYEEGRGTKADQEKARHWYDLARKNGYDHSQQPVAVY